MVRRMVGMVKSTFAMNVPARTTKTWEMPSATPMLVSATKGVTTDLKKSPVAIIRRAMVTGRMMPRSLVVEPPKSCEIASPPVTWTAEIPEEEGGALVSPLESPIPEMIERIARTLSVEVSFSLTEISVVLAFGETKEETTDSRRGPRE